MAELTERLNEVYDRITNEGFVSGKGLGNEIAFYIFDYAPEYELQVREHVGFLVNRISSQTQLKVVDINLFDLLISHLKSRKLLDKSCQLEAEKGISHLKKAVSGPLKTQNIVKVFQEHVRPEEYDLVLISGIGNSWPLSRAHSLLNNLQTIMCNTPLVLFYPGCYNGQCFN